MEKSYQLVAMRPDQHKKLKVMAAKRGMTIVRFLDDLLVLKAK